MAFQLTPLRRGLLFFNLHVVTQVIVLAMSKTLMVTYGFGEVLFLRNFTPWLIFAGYVALKPGFQPWKTKKWKAHLVRGSIGFLNMALLYLSIKLLPLSLALTIRQLEAFVWVGLAAYFYKEKVTRLQWAALVVGFIGVLLVLRPAFAVNITGTMIALAGALSGAYVRVLSRELSRTEKSLTITCFNFTQWTILAAFVMPWDWTMPAGGDWLPLFLAGVVTFASQWLMTEGMALAPAPRLAPFRNAEILWSVLIGWSLWNESIGGWFLAGCALIVTAGIAANWRRSRVQTPSVPV